ncbi:uncharacterized protein [Nicotiana tomentosiformis]|uniref:uncharacterized protein n=1 Tax=Nicotiana tomentosiformis TaxID=4098 RepID=UPI00388C525E
MHNPELSGRLARWIVEISGYNIEYQPQTAIKSKKLADFVADFTPSLIPEVEKELLLNSRTSSGIRILCTGGDLNAKGSKLGIVLKPPTGNIVRQSIRIVKLTNKEAEYEAMIVGLKLAKSLGGEVIEAKCDFLIVVNQVNGTFKVKEERMRRYLDKLQVTLHRFKEWTLQHVPRDQNSEADALANLGSVVEEGHTEISSTSLTLDWINKYIDNQKTGKLPSDPKESRALRTKAAGFNLSKDNTIFRRTFDGPLAICLGLGYTEYVLREVHEGTCGNHSSVESLVRKIIRVGYYYIDMEKDAKEFVRKCDGCQRHEPMIYQPEELLHLVLSPWPFMKWGMDIVGPLPWAPGKARFILFMTDYFSKWVEAQAFEKVREKEAIDFI